MQELENLPLNLETPVYVLDLNKVSENVKKIISSITYPNFQIHYAMFCNDNKKLLKFLKELGLGILILNENEFKTASRLGFSKDKIHLTGGVFNKKSLENILSYGIDMNVDSLRQLELVGEIKKGSEVGIRIKLYGKDITGAGEGISLKDVNKSQEIAKKSNTKIIGLQTYIGTNTLDKQRYLDSAYSLINLTNQFPDLRYLNLGGGFGIPYSSKDRMFDWKIFGKEVSNLFEKIEDKRIQFKIEPGRSIVGDAGCFLTKVIELRDENTLIVDAPYTNFTRPFVYHTNHQVRCLGKKGCERIFNIRGCSINSKDYLSNKEFTGNVAELPTNIQEGDVLCFRDVGAYSPVMQMDFLNYDRAKTIVIN